MYMFVFIYSCPLGHPNLSSMHLSVCTADISSTKDLSDGQPWLFGEPHEKDCIASVSVCNVVHVTIVTHK